LSLHTFLILLLLTTPSALGLIQVETGPHWLRGLGSFNELHRLAQSGDQDVASAPRAPTALRSAREKSNALVAEAWQAWEKNDQQQVETKFLSAIKEDRTHTRAYLGLAFLYALQEKWLFRFYRKDYNI